MARLLAVLVLCSLPANAAVQVWIAGESEKVRPLATPPSSPRTRIELAAAGGECVGAQIVVRSDVPLRELTASGDALRSDAKANVQLDLFRVATIDLEHATGPDGTAGEWPDALIPVRDPLLNERRRAFPVAVPAARAQAIFVESCPARATRGKYLGAVQLQWKTRKGRGSATIPVDLRMRAFDLPATPALPTAFGFSGYSAIKGHGKPYEDRIELTRLYNTIALRRGITLSGGTQEPPDWSPSGDGVQIDWTSYDAEVAPFLDGTALPSGTRWTSVEMREPPKLTRSQRKSWRRAWVEHFRARGWLDRLFFYVFDEPPVSEFPAVEKRAHEIREDAPEIRRLLTTSYSAELPSINLWTVPINCLDVTSIACTRPVPRSRYQGLWWYQACLSHACGPYPERDRGEFIGWPSYSIDMPATAARTMAWLAFANRISGELYFDVVYGYHETDPWISQWAFAGNGDGTLYYPGTVARIGGQHDVPVESLRILQIQRGLQDHAYLTLCARLGDPRFAEAEARAIAPSFRGWARDPAAYATARERLARRIEQLSSGQGTGALGLGRAE
jgi:Domain of unknown function (DUF4091)